MQFIRKWVIRFLWDGYFLKGFIMNYQFALSVLYEVILDFE